MHYFVFCFLKSSPLPMVFAGRAGDSAYGAEWLLAWFLLYLPTCDLFGCHPTYMPFQHQLQSPECYHYTQTIRVLCVYKANTPPYYLRLSPLAMALMAFPSSSCPPACMFARPGGQDEDGKAMNAIARGKLGDLLSIEHWQVSE